MFDPTNQKQRTVQKSRVLCDCIQVYVGSLSADALCMYSTVLHNLYSICMQSHSPPTACYSSTLDNLDACQVGKVDLGIFWGIQQLSAGFSLE
jgi:hypothetical protein